MIRTAFAVDTETEKTLARKAVQRLQTSDGKKSTKDT
jgi:hypothetical protein